MLGGLRLLMHSLIYINIDIFFSNRMNLLVELFELGILSIHTPLLRLHTNEHLHHSNMYTGGRSQAALWYRIAELQQKEVLLTAEQGELTSMYRAIQLGGLHIIITTNY